MPIKNLVSNIGYIDTAFGTLLVCLAAIAVAIVINWGTGETVDNDNYVVTTTTTIFITQEGG